MIFIILTFIILGFIIGLMYKATDKLIESYLDGNLMKDSEEESEKP